MLDYTTIEQAALTLFSDASNPTVIGGEGEFVAKVRGASVILKSNNPITYRDIERATPGVYYRIALRIAAARFPNINFAETDATGTTTFTDNSSNINFQWLQDDIVAMIYPRGASPVNPITNTRLTSFSGGIEWAASKLVAAHVMRNIPLNNSSLKFVDVADNLEVQALEDVDRIIKIESGTSGSASASADDSNVDKGQANFCIAHSIDLTTLPDTAFDVPDPGSSPATYTGTLSFTDVDVVNTLTVGADEVGICYFYMTGQAVSADQDLIATRAYNDGPGDPKHSGSVSFRIERAFGLIGDGTALDENSLPLPTTLDIDQLITIISDEINTETLSVIDSRVANILTAPQRGKARTLPISTTKRELYPNTTTNKDRRGLFNLYHRINKLSFEVRRYSSKVTTEMITIGFYTVPEADWQTYITTPAINRDHRALRATGVLGISGLVFGESDNFSDLGTIVPYSALLNVEKGNVAAVSIAQEAGQTEDADSLGSSAASDVIDTFYFAYEDTNTVDEFISPFTSDLVLRLSTTSYIQSIPINITVDLTTQPFTNPNFTGNPDIPIGEQIAGRVVDAVYTYTRDSNLNNDQVDNANVLGVLLGDYQRIATVVNNTTGTAAEVPLETYIDPVNSLDTQPNFSPIQRDSSMFRDTVAGRVQMVAFRYRDEEYRVVIEVISIPNNLWIATGNYILRRTQWALGRRRAITAETKVLTGSNAVAQQTTAEELASVNASVGKAEASKSMLLQKVYDKRRLLTEAQKGFPTRWHSQT